MSKDLLSTRQLEQWLRVVPDRKRIANKRRVAFSKLT
jgi:hypothetical protein